MANYLVYILRCGDSTYYTGITNDLDKRLKEHQEGSKGAKYTRGRGPFTLLYQEAFIDKGDALRRELEIKALSRSAKEKLIEAGPSTAQNHIGQDRETLGHGVLYLCATPIGNLEDITIRLLKTLRKVDLIAAEDTRHTRKLTTHFHIRTPLTSYHEHNKKTKGPQLVEELLVGKNIALVSDAGMPGISDPGQDLVKLAVEAGVQVIPIPGPSAGVTALVVSGLPTDKFVFEGFLPNRAKERLNRLEALVEESRTMIFYEAPHRLGKTLAAMTASLGNREVAIVRELTKRHEEILRGTLEELVAHYELTEPRGEFCMVVAGKAKYPSEKGSQQQLEASTPQDPKILVAQLVAQGVVKKDAIKEVAKTLGVPKRDVYQAVIVEEDTK